MGAPPKWFGTAFRRLHSAQELAPLLWQAQQAGTWNERSLALAQAYEVLARLQNELQVSRTLPTTVSRFYDRPFPVIYGGRFTQALVEQIADPAVRRIAAQRIIGNINQWSDNTDMEGCTRKAPTALYVNDAHCGAIMILALPQNKQADSLILTRLWPFLVSENHVAPGAQPKNGNELANSY
jgi:hypothetical protein